MVATDTRYRARYLMSMTVALTIAALFCNDRLAVYDVPMTLTIPSGVSVLDSTPSSERSGSELRWEGLYAEYGRLGKITLIALFDPALLDAGVVEFPFAIGTTDKEVEVENNTQSLHVFLRGAQYYLP